MSSPAPSLATGTGGIASSLIPFLARGMKAFITPDAEGFEFAFVGGKQSWSGNQKTVNGPSGWKASLGLGGAYSVRIGPVPGLIGSGMPPPGPTLVLWDSYLFPPRRGGPRRAQARLPPTPPPAGPGPPGRGMRGQRIRAWLSRPGTWRRPAGRGCLLAWLSPDGPGASTH